MHRWNQRLQFSHYLQILYLKTEPRQTVKTAQETSRFVQRLKNVVYIFLVETFFFFSR